MHQLIFLRYRIAQNAVQRWMEVNMMREIMFRGRDPDTGRWYEGFYMALSETTYCFKGDYDSHPENTKHYIVFDRMTDWGLPNQHLRADIDPSTLGQFTGLLDKNGKRIFEGDVVKYTFDMPDNPNATENGKKVIIGRVFFSDWRASFSVTAGRNCSRNLNNDLFKYVRNGNRVEVIGNIHDNPELFKED